jgi:predicted transposase YdaD
MLNRFTQLSEAKVEAMLDIRLQETRVYQEAKGEGRQEEAIEFVLELLTCQLGQKLSEDIRSQVSSLSLSLLKELSKALLNFE